MLENVSFSSIGNKVAKIEVLYSCKVRLNAFRFVWFATTKSYGLRYNWFPNDNLETTIKFLVNISKICPWAVHIVIGNMTQVENVHFQIPPEFAQMCFIKNINS